MGSFPEKQKDEFSYLPIDIALYVFSLCIIIANSMGIYRMCLSYRKIKFENYVLLSGIAESLLIILYKLFRLDFFTLLVQAFQIIITMFISRRFLKLYLILDRKNIKTHIYNTYFIVLVVVNVICILVSLGFCIYSIQVNEGIHDEYIPYSHSGFSCLVSIVLFLFSCQMHRMIVKSLKESSKGLLIPPEEEKEDEEEDGPAVVNGNSQDDIPQILIKPVENSEIYMKTRKMQLYIVALANLGTDTMEFIFYSIKLFIMGEEYFTFSMKTYSKDEISFCILVLEQLCLLLSSLFNYIAFYFIVRDKYEVRVKPDLDSNLLDSEIKKNNDNTNTIIADFIAN